LSLTGLAIVGYGIYLFVQFSKASDDDTPDISPVSDDHALIQLGRPMLMAVTLSDNFFDNLPRAWYVCYSLLATFGAYTLTYVYSWHSKGFVLVVICCINLLSVM